ncbi:MAG: ABC transporter permease [Smithellaceae bacterium]|nr:ABC transporter permease [Smithellaceae bacterium]
MYLRMGWRNIWRNPRRTMVILTAIIIGVWSMIALGALMKGISNQMILNGIATLTGHIQIHAPGYSDDPVVENSIMAPEELEAKLAKLLPPGSHVSARIRVSATANNARHADGVTIVGVDPGAEAKVSFIGHAVKIGRYLNSNDPNGIVIGKALAEKFETGLGKKLVLMSQDRSKNIASRAFVIVGIYRAELEATEKQYIFMNKDVAQQMLGLGKGISEISILLPENDLTTPVTDRLRAALPIQKFDIRPWLELLPMARGYLKIYDTFILIWYLVVFTAMAFGIINTTLMAVYERMREFGLMKALGMKPAWIIEEVVVESLFILLLGVAVGDAISIATVYALSLHGIDLSAFAAGSEFAGVARVIYPLVDARNVISANAVVFVLGILISLYPAAKAARFTPREALLHN